MTTRPFSRLEPLSSPKDPARGIAAFFAVVAAIGTLPGVYGGLCFAFGAVAGVSDAKPAMAILALAMLGYIALGFVQAAFYIGRAAGSIKHGRRWWLSTYFYNMVPLGFSLTVLVSDPHIAAAGATLWFSLLCTLAIVAYGAEPRAGEACDPRRLR